jgi:GT2 family glycosyltransferase
VCAFVRDAHLPSVRGCLASVLDQTVADWAALVLDSTGDPAIVAELEALAAVEPRVTVLPCAAAGAVTANELLERSGGDLLVLMDQDGELERSALAAIQEAFAADQGAAALYTDEDVIGGDGGWRPFLKPDWSPERARSQLYAGGLCAVRREVFHEVGGFRAGTDGAEADDLLLRVSERSPAVGHLARILRHRTASAAAADAAGDPRRDARRRVVADHLQRCGVAGTVEPLPGTGAHRVRRPRPSPAPTVSIVIPTRGTTREVWGRERPLVVEAVASVVERTDYPAVEVVVVADPSTSRTVLDALEALGARVVAGTGGFSFPRRCNAGVAATTGELVALLNDDVLVEQPDWLDVLVGFLAEPEVGIVGPRLLYADGRLQHAGILLNGQPLHIFRGFPADDPGPFDLLRVDREVSAVTAACLLTRRAVLDELGGLSEDFAVAFNDVDLCLRARRAGYRVVWTAHATLYHFESQSRAPRADRAEFDLLSQRWHDALWHDPYGNPNLAPKQAEWLPRLSRRMAGALLAARGSAADGPSGATPLATLARRRARS